MNIFNKPYYPLHHFSYEIFVECPKCKGAGLITTNKDGNAYEKDKSAKFYCLDCEHSIVDQKEWLGYYVGYIGEMSWGRACSNCGSRFKSEVEKTKILYKMGLVKCSDCHKENEYEITWYRYRGEIPADPFFGLDLFFQKEIKNGLLWIYNIEHTQYLKEYINASIRKREYVGLYSMIARLPDFITNAKNKEAISKQLEKFELQIQKLQRDKITSKKLTH